MNYMDFLSSKIMLAQNSGFEISDDEINPALKPHQRDAVRWAVCGGRRALFESFGLGKTVQELEYCRLVIAHKGGRALLVLPLGVRQEFTRDAAQLLHIAPPVYVRSMAEVATTNAPLVMTNYERVRDGDIDPAYFTVTSLDEASVLRSLGTKTYQTFKDKFKGVPYKLVSTATPAPNKIDEIINYAEYLEVLDRGQSLTRFFQRDAQHAGKMTLYPHKEREFWLWVSSWALFVTKPSDLGYDDTGYALPPLAVHYHKITITPEEPVTDRDGQAKLYRDSSVSLTDACREKRESIPARVAKLKEIVGAAPNDHFILWHDLEDERRAIKAALPEAVDIYGAQDLDERERRTIDFSDGNIRLFATKKELSGSGCNFQRHCHRAIFLGIDYKFNDFIQAIHRIYRFLQTEQVVIDVLYTEAEDAILKELQEKWKQHEHMTEKMTAIVRQYGLNGSPAMETLARSIGVERQEASGTHFTVVNNDCVLETCGMESDSVGLIHTSIPFGNHYEYCASYNDFGHNDDTARFFAQLDYLSPELLRVLQPGRVMAVHVKDRVLFGNATGTGFPTMEPFHALCIAHYMKHRFQYFGMITVVTDVVRENNQTYRLTWSERCKDGTKMGVGCPEYILLFRKLPTDTSNGYADVPVTRTKEEYPVSQWQLDAHAFWRSSGDRYLTDDELRRMPIGDLQKVYRAASRETVYSYDEHVALSARLGKLGKLSGSFMVDPPASTTPDVWDDILRIRTLNKDQQLGRREKHVCPLQIDIVDRIINWYSNPGDVVYDPFGGIMTVPVRAVELGRYGRGCELNPAYFRDGVGYLESADAGQEMPTLFDFVKAVTV